MCPKSAGWSRFSSLGAILAIDTCLNACAVAVADAWGVRARLSEPMARGHAERLAPMAQEALEAAGFAPKDLTRVAVTCGPGSFTGVRVGLSFARSFAAALDIPCVGVSTLEALALSDGEGGWRAGLTPAAEGVYAALYHDGATMLAPQRLALEAFLEAAAKHAPFEEIRVFGPAAALFPGARAYEIAAPDIAALALRARTLDPANYPPTPQYLRAPDAKPPKDAPWPD